MSRQLLSFSPAFLRRHANPLAAYAENGVLPLAVADFLASKYFDPTSTSFDGLLTYTGTAPLEMDDASETTANSAHNMAPRCDDLSNVAWALTRATASYGVSDPDGGTSAMTLTATDVNGQVINTISGLSGTVTAGFWLRRRTGTGDVAIFNPNGGGLTNKTLTSSWQYFTNAGAVGSPNTFLGVRIVTSGDEIDIAFPRMYEAPMFDNPDTGDTFVSTGAAAVYTPRIGAYYDAMTALAFDPDYWIDATGGSDSNNGLTEGAAFASISKIASVVGPALSAGETVVVRVKSDTYSTADDHASIAAFAEGAHIVVVFEAGCVMDGTAASAIGNYSAIDMALASSPTNTLTLYGNGLTIQHYNYTTGGASPQGLGWSGANTTLNAYNITIDDCVDGVSGHTGGHANLYDVTVQNCVKQLIANVSESTMDAYRCVFTGTGTETATFATDNGLSGLNRFYDCIFTPGANPGKNWEIDKSEFHNCQFGTATQSMNVVGNGTTDSLVFRDSFVNIRAQAWGGYDLQRCYGLASFRVRDQSGTFTLKRNVFSGPATGLTNILYSNFDDSGSGTWVVHDNIFETATAAAFMSVDATNAGYLVAAGSEFFNNILSGSAAFDADLTAADTGGTVIVDNVTDDALIGAANTFDPDDYGYAVGSPAIGAGVTGGNCGFAVGEVDSPVAQGSVTAWTNGGLKYGDATETITLTLPAATYDVRVVTATGTTDLDGVVHAGGTYWPAAATGFVAQVAVYPDATF